MFKIAWPESGAKGAAMKIGDWTRLLLAAAPVLACFLTGCGDFWEAPTNSTTTGFTLRNSGNLAVAPGATSSDVTITVTPGSSFTGTVTLSCTITSAPTGATSSEYPTCNFSSSSLTFSTATAQTPTVTATATSDTPLGAYDITINGVSGSIAESTSLCVEVSASGTGTCTAASTTSGYFYILNANSTSGASGSIAGFSISSNTLTPVSGSSQSVSGGTAVAIAPSGTFLYVASTSGGITLYSISSTGALTQGVNFNLDKFALALAVDPSGKWLLDASGSGTLTAYPITSTGTLDSTRSTQSQPLATTAVEPGGIAVSPNEALIAVAMGSTGTQIFGFGSETLGAGGTPIKPTNTSAGTAISVAMDPQNRFLYIGEIDSNSTANSGGLRVFTITGTSLAELNAASPTSSGGVAPNSILPIASGDYVYVANGLGAGATTGNITGFGVTSTGISTGTIVATGANPFGLAEDSTDDWIFEVGSSASTYFDAFTFDATTAGKLDSQVTSTSPATSIAVVAAPVAP
jgi:6-phosphogluconolactonase (cycloisomerase 2 family)